LEIHEFPKYFNGSFCYYGSRHAKGGIKFIFDRCNFCIFLIQVSSFEIYIKKLSSDKTSIAIDMSNSTLMMSSEFCLNSFEKFPNLDLKEAENDSFAVTSSQVPRAT